MLLKHIGEVPVILTVMSSESLIVSLLETLRFEKTAAASDVC